MILKKKKKLLVLKEKYFKKLKYLKKFFFEKCQKIFLHILLFQNIPSIFMFLRRIFFSIC